MAPTVCLSEMPSRRSASPFPRRRHRVQNGGISRQQRSELRRLDIPSGTAPLTPPESPLWDQVSLDDSCQPMFLGSIVPQIAARIPADLEDQWKLVVAHREGLIDIVVRTMALVRRNNILQEKVNALRAETSEFIRSVMNNPENKSRQKQFVETRKEAADSSTPEQSDDASSSLPPTPDSANSSLRDDTSMDSSTDWDSESSFGEEP